jgi:toxin ParE1/3/4
MRVRQLSVATVELREAMAWYHERSPRAAENLWLRVQDARRSIVLFPCAAPLMDGRARRFILSGFPYDMIYTVLLHEIVVVAFAHHSRRPSYWAERLREIHQR